LEPRPGTVIGGGLGAGVASADFDDNWIGIPAGIVGGAIIGGAIGYLTAPAEAAPPPPLPQASPPPPVPPVAQKIVLRSVHFDFDKSVIRDVDKPVLDESAETLKANPNIKIEVNRYCDWIGTEPYNLKLSQRRSEAVAEYLEDQGIPAGQLIPQGFGKTHFVATNRNAEGRAQNRRVELLPVDQQ
jgi:OOP family OmpA-OmpF porin